MQISDASLAINKFNLSFKKKLIFIYKFKILKSKSPEYEVKVKDNQKQRPIVQKCAIEAPSSSSTNSKSSSIRSLASSSSTESISSDHETNNKLVKVIGEKETTRNFYSETSTTTQISPSNDQLQLEQHQRLREEIKRHYIDRQKEKNNSSLRLEQENKSVAEKEGLISKAKSFNRLNKL